MKITIEMESAEDAVEAAKTLRVFSSAMVEKGSWSAADNEQANARTDRVGNPSGEKSVEKLDTKKRATSAEVQTVRDECTKLGVPFGKKDGMARLQAKLQLFKDEQKKKENPSGEKSSEDDFSLDDPNVLPDLSEKDSYTEAETRVILKQKHADKEITMDEIRHVLKTIGGTDQLSQIDASKYALVVCGINETIAKKEK